MNVDQLKNEFQQIFGCGARYIVRCPGRVNLIGEHIDYSGYGVLPMAISASTYVLASAHDIEEIVFRNTDETYRAHTHKFGDKWMGSRKPEWYYYFLCGWKGILERLNISPKGMKILVSGTIPPGAGLSSSSSIVCAGALITLVAHTGKTFDVINKAEFAEICAKVERYVGVEGGGMDQATEILANEGSAMRIEFGPLRVYPVILPQNALFAVVHSGETINKAASSQYNERVVECRLAAQLYLFSIMAKLYGLDEWMKIRTLGELAQKMRKNASEMIAVVKEILQASIYTKDNAITLLSITEEDFNKTILSLNTQHMNTFKLAQRALHVYAEASRVRLFHEACKRGELETMGKLMNESHSSCKDLFECSCEKLDAVVEKCLRNGALGARLTGAGWGGCAVALFTNKQPEFEVLFWSRPARGIQLIES
ncbi:unnamed protein product [Thelazia callipaeda]|uniref:Galactokinase n=1 Tax=Thelazia callipaeda TaxID=103827 RepID=A0A0N5CVJ7_THECL|nr:unnamed protein product [Thelazia callipaeda]